MSYYLSKVDIIKLNISSIAINTARNRAKPYIMFVLYHENIKNIKIVARLAYVYDYVETKYNPTIRIIPYKDLTIQTDLEKEIKDYLLLVSKTIMSDESY